MATPKLIQRSSELLANMYDEESALFSYSTRLVKNTYVNDFSNSNSSLRYTINVLAGIQRVRKYELPWDSDSLLERFMQRNALRVCNAGDLGLLLLVLSEAHHDLSTKHAFEIKSRTDDPNWMRKLNLQEISWLLSGTVAYARAVQLDSARDLAARLYGYLRKEFFPGSYLLPRHDRSTIRGRFSSFGALVYYLMAVHAYGDAFGDPAALDSFRATAQRVISLQGPRGEWPWFIDAKVGRVLDWYQIYSVHQDAMAMLFLLPAFDLGSATAERSIELSYRWLFGENELQEPLITGEPFFICRSIRRNESKERQRRYLRSLALTASRRNARTAARPALTINKECRSYHIGWILYVWALRTDFREFTELRLLTEGTK